MNTKKYRKKKKMTLSYNKYNYLNENNLCNIINLCLNIYI